MRVCALLLAVAVVVSGGPAWAAPVRAPPRFRFGAAAQETGAERARVLAPASASASASASAVRKGVAVATPGAAVAGALRAAGHSAATVRVFCWRSHAMQGIMALYYSRSYYS
jgi:hypothetical protein